MLAVPTDLDAEVFRRRIFPLDVVEAARILASRLKDLEIIRHN